MVKRWSVDEKVLYTSFADQDNNLEFFDLKENLTHANIRVPATVRNPMFVGYDRFGRQLCLITEQGSVLSWNPISYASQVVYTDKVPVEGDYSLLFLSVFIH